MSNEEAEENATLYEGAEVLFITTYILLHR